MPTRKIESEPKAKHKPPSRVQGAAKIWIQETGMKFDTVAECPNIVRVGNNTEIAMEQGRKQLINLPMLV